MPGGVAVTAHCVVSVVADTAAGPFDAATSACVVHCHHAPCPDNGKPANRNLSRSLRQVGQGFFVSSVVGSGDGWLIHVVVGSVGGSGCLRTNRSGVLV